jgi:hypothetical protein
MELSVSTSKCGCPSVAEIGVSLRSCEAWTQHGTKAHRLPASFQARWQVQPPQTSSSPTSCSNVLSQTRSSQTRETRNGRAGCFPSRKASVAGPPPSLWHHGDASLMHSLTAFNERGLHSSQRYLSRRRHSQKGKVRAGLEGFDDDEGERTPGRQLSEHLAALGHF